MNTRDKALKKARKTNKECDWSSYKRKIKSETGRVIKENK